MGNYYIPYNVVLAVIAQLPMESPYCIMFFSAVFDYIIALFSYKIVKYIVLTSSVESVINEKEFKVFAVGLTLLPIMIENTAIWKQCDSVYTALMLISIFLFLKHNYTMAFIVIGIGFAFKMQMILILPFFGIAYLVRKDFSLLEFLWIPFFYLLGGLPAIFCGRNILDTYSIYLSQTEIHKEMCVNFPGIYHLGMDNYGLFLRMALVMTIVVFAFSYLRIRKYTGKITHVGWMYLAGWSLLSCVEFLPKMHERYDFPAIIFLTLLMLFFRRKLAIPVLGLHVISACTYANFLYGFDSNMKILAVAYLIIYVIVTYDMFKYLEDSGRQNEQTCIDRYLPF